MVKLHWHSQAPSDTLHECNRTSSCFFLRHRRSDHKRKDNHFASRSRKVGIVKADDVNSDVPASTPVQGGNVKRSNKQKLGAIFGGAAVALLVVIVLVLLYFCLKRLKGLIRRAFVTESPLPSAEWQRAGSPNSVALSAGDVNVFQEFTLLDLENATRNFDQSNFIGEGAFGMVYKGLLEDGSIVVVKRHLHFPNQSLVHEVKHIARVNHKHLVKVVGFCEENHQRFLVNDYHLNGNVGSHLYDAEGSPIGNLDVPQRLSIAIGAAKGLEHLHSLLPPILHMHFRTSNVLVDETFTAKVSDFGILGLLVDYNASPSSVLDCFLDPELASFKNFSAGSDVYSFGVFLLEVISGRKAISWNKKDDNMNIVFQAKGLQSFEDFVDKTIRHHSLQAMKQMLDLALLCVDAGFRRPSMKSIVQELERIQKEIRGFDINEGIGNVTLGSELFSGSSSTGLQSPIS